MKIMKAKISAVLLAFITLFAGMLTFSSCEDLMETDSDMQAFDPDMNAKTDSVFYAFGIGQAMQQLADQYFFQGEMRGELVATTQYTDSTLSQLKDFSAGLENKYDSAYVYYRVINNCNNYIAHRDTTLQTGSTKVAIKEYAAVLAFRAWAYLQLCRNYGSVPFFTEPLTTISQIEKNTFPTYDLEQITAALAPEMLKFTSFDVPNYGNNINVGSTNHGSTKQVTFKNIFVPVGVVLGDMYLECGKYESAAKCYVDYLTNTKQPLPNIQASLSFRNADFTPPTDMEPNQTINGSANYANIFAATGTPTDVISYIPMAVNSVNGATTIVPYSFGYDYYSLTNTYFEEIQLVPSDDYNYLTENQTYYYRYRISGTSKTNGMNDIKGGKFGDMRSQRIMYTQQGATMLDEDEEDISWINKFQSGNIILYRLTTVYLHLCEALNRMGMPDLAFGFLKEGINSSLRRQPWLSQQAYDYLDQTFLQEAYYESFFGRSYPIHQHGCGFTSDANYIGSSPYQYESQVDSMLKVLSADATLYPGLAERLDHSHKYAADLAAAKAEAEANATVDEETGEKIVPPYSVDPSGYGTMVSKQDTIMAIEELLCDEEAMEFCFEGTRWYDLMRFAKHKNNAGLAGNAWLVNKVRNNHPIKDLSNQSNWYLPFKR